MRKNEISFVEAPIEGRLLINALEQSHPFKFETKDLETYVDVIIKALKKHISNPSAPDVKDDFFNETVALAGGTQSGSLIVRGLEGIPLVIEENFQDIRRALFKKLKGRLSSHPELHHLYNHALFILTESGVDDKSNLKRVRDLDDKPYVFREDDKLSQAFQPLHEKALKVLHDLQEHFPHPGIIDINQYNEGGEWKIVESERMIDLQKYVDEKDFDLSIGLEAFINCVDFARILGKAGLVLQDISLNNIAVRRNPKSEHRRGLFPDIEGLACAGDTFYDPVYHINRIKKRDHLAPEAADDDAPFQASEMTFQLGLSLEKFIKLCIEERKIKPPFPAAAVGRLLLLAQKMQSFNPYIKNPIVDRPDLAQVMFELDEIARTISGYGQIKHQPVSQAA